VPSASIAYVGSVGTASSPKGDLWIGDINIAGSVGDAANPSQDSIIAQSINDITAGGDIAATITSTGSAQVPGATGTFRSTGGKILGTITANGTLGLLNASGDIGTSSAPLSIIARSGIISVIGNNAFVDLQANAFGGTGSLGRIETRTGDLSGIIKAHSLAGGFNPNEEAIKVAGALRANVEVQTSIDKAIRCGSLVGQVTANRANSGAGWNQNVIVNNATLSPVPAYSATSASLGGGAVGLVPFRVYSADSSGALIWQSVINSAASNDGYSLGFYGPVSFASGTSNPSAVIVQRKTLNNTFIDFSACAYTAFDAAKPRVVRIIGRPSRPLPFGEYQIVQRGDAVKCDLGSGSNPSVASFSPIDFRIMEDCNGNNIDDRTEILNGSQPDLNGDGHIDGCNGIGFCGADYNGDLFLDFTDFDAFVADFESGAPGADMNGDGFLDFTDYDAFDALFNDGCYWG